MKKLLVFAAVAMMFTACNNGKTTSKTEGADSVSADSTVYVGMLPAADSYGIRYRLALANDTTMGYSLEQAYLKSEQEVDTVMVETGKAEVKKKGEKTYYVLKQADPMSSSYFLQLNDSTLRMVNDQLEEAVEGPEKYDLKLQK